MPRSGINGTYTLPGPQKTQVPNTPILSSVNNQGYADIEQTFNTPQPIAYGGTNATTPIGAMDNLMTKGTDVATAATLNLDTALGQFVDLTGTTTVTAVTLSEGRHRMTRAAGNFQITVGASLIGNGGGANIAVQTGDLIFWEGYSGGVVRFWVVKGGALPITATAIQVFSASGPYTPNARMQFAMIEVVAGGGSGGGAVGVPGAGRVAGGGGSGGYSRKLVTRAQIGTSQPVTIGGGGAAAAGANGNPGGTTSVGSLVSALGGLGGAVNNGGGSDPSAVAGVGVGDVAFAGSRGQGGGLATNLQVLLIAGSGGDGPFGGGGPGARNGNGGSGSAPGAGGGGAAANSNAVTSDAGGPGAAGISIITEFLA